MSLSFHFLWGEKIPGSLLMKLRNILIFFPEVAWVQLLESQGLEAWKHPGSQGVEAWKRWQQSWAADVAVGTGERCWMSWWSDLVFLRLLYSLYQLLISCFLLAGLMIHRSAFSEMSPLLGHHYRELCHILTAFDIFQAMLKSPNWQCLTLFPKSLPAVIPINFHFPKNCYQRLLYFCPLPCAANESLSLLLWDLNVAFN